MSFSGGYVDSNNSQIEPQSTEKPRRKIIIRKKEDDNSGSATGKRRITITKESASKIKK